MQISGVICASNGEDGVQVTGAGKVRLSDGRLFTNTFDGFNADLHAGQLQLVNTLSASNSRYSFNLFRETAFKVCDKIVLRKTGKITFSLNFVEFFIFTI